MSAGLLCLSGAAISFVFCYNWGFTLFDVVDHYVNVYLMLLVGALECMGATWVFQAKETMDKGYETPVLIMFYGYWIPACVLAILTFAAFPD